MREERNINNTEKQYISTIMCYGFQFRWLISNWVRERETRKMHPSTCCIRRKKVVSLELHHCGCKWSKSPPDQRAPTTFSWQFAIFLFINCLSDAAALLVSLSTVIFFLHFQAGESLAAIKTSVIRTRNQKWLERLRVFFRLMTGGRQKITLWLYLGSTTAASCRCLFSAVCALLRKKTLTESAERRRAELRSADVQSQKRS